ncbi:BPSL0761 family protein [Burkholderia vietnamiensis]|uniref:BPSL0761 family protein n=1 Tax=Burkholderia vietnamiensis TaxID=60552 RepID=UPI00158B47A2|nr:BPSL0761 family protein [Burkholderia vietnamiensis]
MTTPRERTKAIADTRELLQMLARADKITIDGLIQTVALGLLRHYPLDTDLDASAAALPETWAAPEHRQSDATAAPQGQGSSGESNADEGRNGGKDDGCKAYGS